MTNHRDSIGLRHGLAAVLVALLWGGNFVAAKLAMMHYPPILLSTIRFTLVAALLLPFVKTPKHHLKEIFYISLTLGTIHFTLVFIGIYKGLDITTSVLTVQLGVPFSCLLGTFFLNDRLGWFRSTGMLISFIGIALTAGTPNIMNNFVAFLMVMSGAFAWSVSNIQLKRMGNVPILSVLAWISIFSAPQLLLVSLALEHDQWHVLQTATLPPSLAIVYSSIFSTIVAYGTWYYLLQNHPVSQVAPFNLLVPLFGVTFGVLIFNEALTWHIIVGGLITMIGVGIIVIRRPRTVAIAEEV